MATPVTPNAAPKPAAKPDTPAPVASPAPVAASSVTINLASDKKDAKPAADGTKGPVYPIPAEAEKIEADLKKKKKELAGIKTRSIVELEEKESMVASYEARLPRYPADLINEETLSVSAKKEEL